MGDRAAKVLVKSHFRTFVTKDQNITFTLTENPDWIFLHDLEDFIVRIVLFQNRKKSLDLQIRRERPSLKPVTLDLL
jgi:hypothetical protein